MISIKTIIKTVSRQLGFDIVNHKLAQQRHLHEKAIAEECHALKHSVKLFENVLNREEFSTIPRFSELDFLRTSLPFLTTSKSQILQDLFVIYVLNGKRNGYFIEFGATNGISLSNTYLLENGYGWQGILCEPGRGWHKSLCKNRKCIVDLRCVWTKSGETLRFNEASNAVLSTLEMFNSADYHAESRKEGNVYAVETISLNDLLATHSAPKEIDYLSIDTEGSEFDILDAFDFNSFDIKVITVEHNHTPMREKIHHLLQVNGYRRIFEQISYFDDWYVKAELLNAQFL